MALVTLPAGTVLEDGHAVLGTFADLEVAAAGLRPPTLSPVSPGAQASPFGLLPKDERERMVETGGPAPGEPAGITALRDARQPYRGEFELHLITDADPSLGLGLQMRAVFPFDGMLLAATLDPRPGTVTVEVFTPERLARDTVEHLMTRGAPADDPMLKGWATLQLIRPEAKALATRSITLVVTREEPQVVRLEEKRSSGLRRTRQERLDPAQARSFLEGLPGETFR